MSNCRICPLVIPSCPDCGSGKTCIFIEQSCERCASTSCLDNAALSSGRYTIGSFGVPGPVSTVNPQSPSVPVIPGTSSSLSISSAILTTTASDSAVPTTTAGDSTTASASNPTLGTTIESSTQASSPATSPTSSPTTSANTSPTPSTTTGAAPTIGRQPFELQGLLLLIIAFWIGMGLFGGRRLRI